MYQHDSTCLKGPKSRARQWWHDEPDEAGGVGLLTAPAEGLRHELIARVRQEIADGTYDSPERWQAALDRLLDRLEAR